MPSTSVATAGVSALYLSVLPYTGRTLLFQIDAALGDDDRDVAIDIALALFVEQ